MKFPWSRRRNGYHEELDREIADARRRIDAEQPIVEEAERRADASIRRIGETALRISVEAALERDLREGLDGHS